MKIKLGVSLEPSEPVVQNIERVSKWGVGLVEIYIEPPFNTPEMLSKKALLIKKALQSHSLLAVGHAYPWCDLGSPDVAVRAAWLIEIKKAIAAAAKAGIVRIDVHADSAGIEFVPKGRRSDLVENLIASFALLVEEGKRHDIAIAAENTWEKAADFKHLLSKVKGLHATLDIGHAYAHGGMKSVQDFLKINEIDHIHVMDQKSGIDHLPIGDGEIDFRQIVQTLKERNYNGTAVLEVFASKLEKKQSFDKFRKLLSD